MPGELLIAAGPGEWRAALLEDGIPVELFVERGDRNEAGSIHLGRARRLLAALGAALVDIGGDRAAFLPLSEVLPRGRRLDEGERVVVQIRREAQGGKAARVTTGIALRGQVVELRWGRPGILGSQTLSPEERARLLSAVEAGPASPHPPADAGPSLPHGHGGGSGWGLRLLDPAPISAVVVEIADLLSRWRDVHDRAVRLAPPARLDPHLSFAAALANALPVVPDSILTDDPATIPELRSAFPGASIQHRPEAEWPIDLDAVFDQALSGTVALDDSGYVHFDAARAAIMVDVDSGTPETGSPERTGLAVNLAAAGAIARQIRLRNLGGGIVIDFIGLDDRRLRGRIRDALTEALAPDPARPQILGWTQLGHLELVRPRRGRPPAEILLEPRPGGPLVKTAVTVAHEVLCALRREARAQPGRGWRLTIAPGVAAALAGGAATALHALEQRFGREIAIEVDPNLDRDRFQVAPA
ncbi:MAG TPA: ribonuclease E/G [Stellaceae bacterium]|nr:ribonuclease E/G [Stellaceae bacterium]HMD63463.1 ribonuclease E/G [Stellaceae bacterium]